MRVGQAWLALAVVSLVVCASAGARHTRATAGPTPVQNLDPADQGARVGATDVITVMRFLDPRRGLYQVEFDNTSDIGYINTFQWVPPPGMTITSITSSEGGRCHLANGAIACVGSKSGLAPPACTCRSGGKLTVNFSANGLGPTWNGQWWTYYGVVGGATQVTSVTPVPYHIPSYLPPDVDVPLCAKGQVPTKDRPCSPQ